jgi:hypothetical protein
MKSLSIKCDVDVDVVWAGLAVGLAAVTCTIYRTSDPSQEEKEARPPHSLSGFSTVLVGLTEPL